MGGIHKKQVNLFLLDLFDQGLQGVRLKALLGRYLGSVGSLFDFAALKFVFLRNARTWGKERSNPVASLIIA